MLKALGVSAWKPSAIFKNRGSFVFPVVCREKSRGNTLATDTVFLHTSLSWEFWGKQTVVAEQSHWRIYIRMSE
jgi:hypothetical protein